VEFNLSVSGLFHNRAMEARNY